MSYLQRQQEKGIGDLWRSRSLYQQALCQWCQISGFLKDGYAVAAVVKAHKMLVRSGFWGMPQNPFL
jgi:hypothetical protein